MKDSTRDILTRLGERYPALTDSLGEIGAACETIAAAVTQGKRLYICGNGGSMADAQHIAGELLKSFVHKRPLPDTMKAALTASYGEEGAVLAANLQGSIPVQTLGCEAAFVTAFGNDCSPEFALAQQVYGLVKQDDVLLTISTSGNSGNCLHAARVARILGAKVIALTGRTGGKLKPLSDICIRVPAREPYLVQEYHLPVYHALCLMLENEFFPE